MSLTCIPTSLRHQQLSLFLQPTNPPPFFFPFPRPLSQLLFWSGHFPLASSCSCVSHTIIQLKSLVARIMDILALRTINTDGLPPVTRPPNVSVICPTRRQPPHLVVQIATWSSRYRGLRLSRARKALRAEKCLMLMTASGLLCRCRRRYRLRPRLHHRRIWRHQGFGVGKHQAMAARKWVLRTRSPHSPWCPSCS